MMAPRRMMLRPNWLQALMLLSLWMVMVSSFHGGPKILALKSIRTAQHLARPTDESFIFTTLRGGSTEEEYDQEESDEDEEESDSEDEDESDSGDEQSEADDDDEESPLSSVISSEPLNVNIKTNLGNRVVDQSIELLVSRTRDVASVKNTLSRQLPGRPPISALTLMTGPRVLMDDELVDELVDDQDEDDDDEDDEESSTLVLTLDMVPPVDPKFATTLQLDEMTTSEMLDAYAANAASMYNNAQSLVSEPSADKAFGSLSIQLRHEAYRIRDQLASSFPESALAKLEEETPPHETQAVEQRRGQRYRSGRGGAKTNMKRTIQRNLNVNWPDTIRNFMLFIFFGLFGGRNSVSRNLLLLGAPLCFVLQARPVKILLKQTFYALANPPGIFLSLLPAPQQAILSFNENDAREELYGIDKEVVDVEISDEEDDYDESDGDDYDDYDSGDESDY